MVKGKDKAAAISVRTSDATTTKRPLPFGIDNMGIIPGYENTTFESSIHEPPVLPDWRGKLPKRENIINLPSYTKEQVRETVNQYISKNFILGKAVVKEMDIKDIHISSEFHYSLETFCEKRESAWCFTPNTGKQSNKTSDQQVPAPWDVLVLPEQYFKEAKSQIEVPNTSCIKKCPDCKGSGEVCCKSCTGDGKQTCSSCNGTGRRKYSEPSTSCPSCDATGNTNCKPCSGTGKIECKTCSGRGDFWCFVELTVSWNNNLEDYVSETDVIPCDLIRKVSGQIPFKEQAPRVWPMTNCDVPLLNSASNELVTKHSKAFRNQQILQQRHHLRIIPVAKCEYEWKNNVGSIYVYGLEKEVYFPDHPKMCCFGCSIL